MKIKTGHHLVVAFTAFGFLFTAINVQAMGSTPEVHDHSKHHHQEHYPKGGRFSCPACARLAKSDPKLYARKLKVFKVVAYQFAYSPKQIVVKKGDIVRIILTSRDVPHGFYIKEYGINAKAIKGKNRVIEFIANKVGRFKIICSVYCGTGHHKMQGSLVVK